ncbi:MAG: AzlC family ABC transporter permease [Lautropia sp.]
MSVKALIRHPEFGVGAREMATVLPGMAAWGVMTGVAMLKSGMSVAEATLMAVVVFAGSSQLAAMPLIAAGASDAVILATAFCVNLRFVVFSAHLRDYVAHHGRWQRMLRGYLMADIGYSFFVGRFPEVPTDARAREACDAYWLGSGLTGWAAWVVSGLAGIALGNAVPVAWGLPFAGVLALLGILYSLTTSRLRAVSVAVAGAVAVLAFAMPLKLNIVVAIVASVIVCMLLERSLAARPSR